MNISDTSFVYKISVWIMRLSVLNLLWIFFSVAGLGVIGLFPATVAMFTVVRKWIRGETEIPLWRTFFASFKSNLWKANVLGYIVSLGGVLLYMDYIFIQNMSGNLYLISLLLLFMITFYYAMILFFIFPVYVHYDIKLMECLKYAFIIGASYPLRTLYMAFTIFVIYYVTASFPILFCFFSGSAGCWLVMRFAYVVFEQTQAKHRKELKTA
ncbi:YesL family protein [Gracilibacillus caseinilyticus]|uniref:YesL family protein n=1 Tax=Gracilibacillus caseinilyticus TaxID=2932256 RepID=A0ABY4F1S3_9BACI|nr:YesL family protein [Gracilibacillus caseinilyticus]UOQ50434.1 YesL family protein [Gracilibacillus caseinilyticus]